MTIGARGQICYKDRAPLFVPSLQVGARGLAGALQMGARSVRAVVVRCV